MSHLDLNQLRTDFKATESRGTRGGREPIRNIFNLRPRFIVHSDFSVSILSSKGPFFNLKFSKLKVLLKVLNYFNTTYTTNLLRYEQ